MLILPFVFANTSSGYHKIPCATHFKTDEPSESIDKFIGTKFPDPG
jgi:hypothetical protein